MKRLTLKEVEKSKEFKVRKDVVVASGYVDAENGFCVVRKREVEYLPSILTDSKHHDQFRMETSHGSPGQYDILSMVCDDELLT